MPLDIISEDVSGKMTLWTRHAEKRKMGCYYYYYKYFDDRQNNFFKFEAAQSLGTLWLKFRLIRNAVDSRFYNSAQIVFDKDQLYHSDTPISLDPFL